MADPLGLVYSGRDDTGDASVLKGRVSLAPLLADKRDRQAANEKDADKVANKLSKIDNKLSAAWIQDYDELQTQYSAIEEQIFAYEKAGSKEKPEMKKKINESINRLRFKVHKSTQGEKEYTRGSRNLDLDKGGYYDSGARERLEGFRNQKLDDRPSTHVEERASLQGYLSAVKKNVGYQLDTVVSGNSYTDADGKKHSVTTKTKVVDEKKLKKSISSALTSGGIAENQMNMLNDEATTLAIKRYPGLQYKTKDEVDKIIEEVKVDIIYDNMVNGYREMDSKIVVNKAARAADDPEAVYMGISWSGKKANTTTEYIDKDSTYTKGGYRVTVRAKTNTRVITNPIQEFEIKGSDLAKIVKSGVVDGMDFDTHPNGSFMIEGVLDGVEIGENGEQPMLLLTAKGVVAKALGRAAVIKIPLNYTNRTVIEGFGIPDIEELIENTKIAAKSKWDEKNTPPKKTVPGKTAGPTPGKSRQDPVDVDPTPENTKEDNPHPVGSQAHKDWAIKLLKKKYEMK